MFRLLVTFKSVFKNYTSQMQFVARNNLESILQYRLFQKEIRTHFNAIPSELLEINRTGNSGDVVLQIFFDGQFAFGGHIFRFGFQFQGNTFKFNFAAKEYRKSKVDWMPGEMEDYFRQELLELSDYDRLNLANREKGKAYVSVSKNQYTLHNKDIEDIKNELMAEFTFWENVFNTEITERFEDQME